MILLKVKIVSALKLSPAISTDKISRLIENIISRFRDALLAPLLAGGFSGRVN